MPSLLRLSAVFIVVVALAPPAVADPVDPIPGNGVFVVGSDVAPGLYHTGGSGSTFGVWINNVPTQDSMCSWFTYSTPDAAKDHVLQTNTSVGPMFANIGGFLTTLLYGYPGLRLGPGEPDTWAERAVVLPRGWKALHVERLWVRGEARSLTAVAGEPAAVLDGRRLRRAS